MKAAVTVMLWCIFGLQAATLELCGSVEKPVVISEEAFERLPHTVLEGPALVCRSGEVKRPAQQYRGVLLATLLNGVNIKNRGRGTRNRIAVLVTAHDGYSVLFGYPELFNTPTGEGVLVTLEEEGFALYSQRDYVTGPRHVRNLKQIELITLNPSQKE